MASQIGISYCDLMKMDIRIFNNYVDGYNMRREIEINDKLQIGHIIAGKISQAVWGDKRFKKPVEHIDLFKNPDVFDERNKKVIRTLKSKGII